MDIAPAHCQLDFVINMTQIRPVCRAFRARLGEIPATHPGPEIPLGGPSSVTAKASPVSLAPIWLKPVTSPQ